MPKVAALTLLFVFIALEVAAADGIESPQEQFAGYPTRIDEIPPGWATTNPILLRVCFNLKYPVNGPEANAFLRELHSTISSMEFGVDIRIERTIRPATYAYCASMAFRDWETNRRYENSAVFLSFYEQRWKPAVTEAHEHLSVLDTAAAGDD